VFPQLMGSLPVPQDPTVWELSRFTAVDPDAAPAEGASRQFSSRVAVDLLRAVLKVAAEHGVQRLITVSPLGVERLLRRAGFLAQRVVSPMVIDGHAIFACWIEVPQLQIGRALALTGG
jgi:N-acyl-L-homoserine lactone synthetase